MQRAKQSQPDVVMHTGNLARLPDDCINRIMEFLPVMDLEALGTSSTAMKVLILLFSELSLDFEFNVIK